MRIDPRALSPLLALVLAACTSGEAPRAPTATASPQPPSGPTSTSTAPPPTPAPRAAATTRTAPPPLGPAEWDRGAEGAPITIDAYCDFQATGCAALAPLLEALLEEHPEDLRLVYHQFPLLRSHDKASLAAQAAEAAGAQGRFWDFYDLLYGEWADWVLLSPEDFAAWLVERAESMGLDTDLFEGDLESGRYRAAVEDAFDSIAASGINATPVVYLQGRLVQLDLNLLNLEAAIRLELLTGRQYLAAPPMLIDPAVPLTATLHLDLGDVVIELLPASAPTAVNSFVFLAREGWFDGNPFHRVIPGMLAETGDPSGTGLGGPGYFFGDELDPDLDFSEPGVVALSSAGLGTNGSQFFITLGPLPQLDGARTIFGRVVSGLEILASLERRDPLLDLLTPPGATILSVTIDES
jgi:cyclophilin family peptidyl-prolyl cis-trans isomerase/protein-disulfide isomerase